MINLSAQDVAEQLDAIVNLVKDVPVRITDETGLIAIMISFEAYEKLIGAQNALNRAKATLDSETIRNEED